MKVFEKFQLGNLSLNNRVVMAPMTRSRAINNIPNSLMETYYQQRSGAGLIITEGTSPSPNGLGYPRIPGAYSIDQIEGWKKIAAGVHDEGGYVFVQLMHTGRVTAILNLPENGKIIAPSAIQLGGEMYTDLKGMVAYDTPHEMTNEEIKQAQAEFVHSSKSLIQSGIDGVELHSANGYLLDQFLNPNSNNRVDNYGGNFKNRARFVLETTQKVVETIGGEKVGIRFSPYGAFNDMTSNFDDLTEMYTYLALELKKLKIAYIHIADQRVAMGAPEFKSDITKAIKDAFKGVIISGGDVQSTERAEELLASESIDLVYIGRPFISNPDLIQKFKNKEELNEYNMDTFYTPGADGYTDY